MAIEAANRPAAMRHGDPVAERLDRVGRTVGEVGKVVAVRQRQREADHARGRAACRRRAWHVAHAVTKDLLVLSASSGSARVSEVGGVTTSCPALRVAVADSTRQSAAQMLRTCRGVTARTVAQYVLDLEA